MIKLIDYAEMRGYQELKNSIRENVINFQRKLFLTIINYLIKFY